jgi:hypothetical protein
VHDRLGVVKGGREGLDRGTGDQRIDHGHLALGHANKHVYM